MPTNFALESKMHVAEKWYKKITRLFQGLYIEELFF